MIRLTTISKFILFFVTILLIQGICQNVDTLDDLDFIKTRTYYDKFVIFDEQYPHEQESDKNIAIISDFNLILFFHNTTCPLPEFESNISVIFYNYQFVSSINYHLIRTGLSPPA